MRDFFLFIRMQGVIGLAIGFLLGGAVSKLVSSFVEDIVNPVLGIFFGRADDLSSYSTWIGASEIRWGSFLSMLIDFAVIAAIVYFGFKGLGLERIDIKKEAQAELKKIKKM